jgi:hypothetical protein
MKQGRSIEQLAAEVLRQAQTKRDFISRTESMAAMDRDGGEIALAVGDKGEFPVNKIAHDQIGEHCGIPRAYYQRMQEHAPDLLATNINRWFAKYPAARMVRTLDGRARAFLSDAYRPLDNFDFIEAVYPILEKRKLTLMACEVTDTRLYLKAVDEQLFKDVPVGFKMGDGSHKIFDTCAPAIILSNSEVGYGRLVIETGVYTSACTNMALFAGGGGSFKRTHIGARHKIADGVSTEEFDSIMSDATKKKTLEALWSQAGDVIGAAFSTKVIGERLEKLADAAGYQITGNIEKVVEVAAEKFGLNDGERGSVLRHLIEGGKLSKYGLHAAITRAAQDCESFDRATDLEYLGGKVIELPKTEWEVLAKAA